MFGAVGAYSWSGGIVQDFTHQMMNSSFINATNTEEDIRDSYLGKRPYTLSVSWLIFYFIFIITLQVTIAQTLNPHIHAVL